MLVMWVDRRTRIFLSYASLFGIQFCTFVSPRWGWNSSTVAWLFLTHIVLQHINKFWNTDISLKFLSLTNAPLYYTYKMLKYTVKISHDCSYIFRSIWTIIRESMPNLAKVTILYCVPCTARHTIHTADWNTFTNIAEHLTTLLTICTKL